MTDAPESRQRSSLIGLIEKIAFPIEMIALLGTSVGLLCKYQGLDGANEILMIAMSALAGIYFATAYVRRTTVNAGGSERFGMFDLLANLICVKVAWIGMSVVIVGAQYTLLHLHGSAEMLMIGTSVLCVAILIMVAYISTNSERGRHLIPVLYRAIPVVIIGGYLFLNKPL